jgi:pyruvate/2-oxoglutarate dehydrogenase complex dihydrolipoamide dehydrogenase (E3) component
MLSRNFDYDLVILGGGYAGTVAGVVAGGAGLRTLLIEKGRMGGACTNTGCVPSKALLHAAQVAHEMRTADHVGLRPVPLSREDAADVLRHVRATICETDETDAISGQLRQHGVTIRIGDARFISPDAIELSEREGPTRLITADHFLLATGSHPARPAIHGLDETGYLTNERVFDLDKIPESMIVIGGGSVGVEMGQAFARLGCHVTVVETNAQILPEHDGEVSRALENVLTGEGIEIRTATTVTAVRAEESRKIAHVEHEGSMTDISAQAILLAAGRAPNLDGLSLDAARVEFDSHGVKVNAKLHTSGPRVWACGDVIGRYQFSHLAEYESRLVVRNILYPFDQRTDPGFRLSPWATCTDPEVARVGLAEESARKKGIDYKIYKQSFDQNEFASSNDTATGFVKVLATGWQGKVLGAHIIGPRAGELIQEWIQAMTRGLTLRQVAETIHVYPTLSMANQHAATQWSDEKAESPLAKRALGAYTRAVRPNMGTIVWGLASIALITGGALLANSMRKPTAEPTDGRA